MQNSVACKGLLLAGMVHAVIAAPEAGSGICHATTLLPTRAQYMKASVWIYTFSFDVYVLLEILNASHRDRQLYLFAVYELEGEGIDGRQQYFRKPWFMTTLMFLGMSLCLPLAYLEERLDAGANGNTDAPTGEPLLGSAEVSPACILVVARV